MVSVVPVSELRGESDLDRVLVWLAGACATAGGAAGVVVGGLEALDDGQGASDYAVYAVAGVVVGAFLGLCASVGSIFVLVAVQGRRWASAPPVRAALVSAGAAGPIDVLLLALTGLALPLTTLAFCSVVTALPAATVMVALDVRSSRRHAAA